MERVQNVVVFSGRPPLWWRHIAKITGSFGDDVAFKPPKYIPPADTLYLVGSATSVPSTWRYGRLVIETDTDGVPPEARHYNELLIHVDSYEVARRFFGNPRVKFVVFVDTSSEKGLVDGLFTLSRLWAARQHTVVEFNKWGDAKLNYILSLLVYRLGTAQSYVRDVSYYNIVSYIEGENVVYSDYPFPPVQVTYLGARQYGCPHGAFYLGSPELSQKSLWHYESYQPCPAMRPMSDPYMFLVMRVFNPMVREELLEMERRYTEVVTEVMEKEKEKEFIEAAEEGA